MELRHLKYFVTVAEEENVTRASERLHISQPSLSRQIRDLEHEVGVPLFNHGPKSIQLTEAGRTFQAGAKEVLAKVDKVVTQVRTMAQQLHGDLHVGYSPSLTTEILPLAMKKFHTMCGQVRVHLYDLSTRQMIEKLRSGHIDVALLVKPSSPGLNGLLYKELVQIRPSIAMPMNHALANTEAVTPHMLANHPLVTYDQQEYPEHRAWLMKVMKGIRPTMTIASEYDSATSLIVAVESGIGLALVNRDFRQLAGSRIKVAPMTASTPCLSLGIAWTKSDRRAETHHFISAALRPDTPYATE